MNLKPGFNSWLNFIDDADLNNIKDMKETFNSADLLGEGCERIVFKVGGNDTRINCYRFREKETTSFHQLDRNSSRIY